MLPLQVGICMEAEVIAVIQGHLCYMLHITHRLYQSHLLTKIFSIGFLFISRVVNCVIESDVRTVFWGTVFHIEIEGLESSLGRVIVVNKVNSNLLPLRMPAAFCIIKSGVFRIIKLNFSYYKLKFPIVSPFRAP